MSLPVPGGEIRGLTGIRGIAALWVVCLHYEPLLTSCLPAWKHLAPIYGKGHLGVDLFFILSGLILCHVYRPDDPANHRHDWRQFLWFRFARIYPNHLATFLLLVIMLITARVFRMPVEGSYPLAAIPGNLTLTHAFPWIDRLGGGAGWNYPSWSISAEFFAYIAIFPLAGLTVRRVGKWWAMHLLIAYGALAGLTLLYQAKWMAYPTPLVMVSLEFLAGCHLYAAIQARPGLVRLAGAGLSIVVLADIAACYLLPDALARMLILFGFPVILTGLIDAENICASLLSSPMLHWLGLISYAIYMGHAVVQKLCKGFLAAMPGTALGPVMSLGVFLAIWIAVIGFAAILYYVIEKPCQAALRRWFKERSPRTSAWT